MKPLVYYRLRKHVVPQETAWAKKEIRQNPGFFGTTTPEPFFKPQGATGYGQLIQARGSKVEKEEEKVHRQEDQREEEKVQKRAEEEEEPIQKASGDAPGNKEETLQRQPLTETNTRHYANCEGVTVEGHTDANYGHTYTAPGRSAPGTGCNGCTGGECVTNTGTVISVFTANPQITLPDVPSGLNACEQEAVQNFINTTLRRHEQQHVAAFNTYRGTVRTPYTFRGCAGGVDAHTRQIHDNIESARRARSDAASAALDANGANRFRVACECPDPEPEK